MSQQKYFLSVGESVTAGSDPVLNGNSLSKIRQLAVLVPNNLQRIYVGTGRRHGQILSFLPNLPVYFAPIFGIDAFCPVNGKYVILGDGQLIEKSHIFVPKEAAARGIYRAAG